MCGPKEQAQPTRCVLRFIWTLLRTVAQEGASTLRDCPSRVREAPASIGLLLGKTVA